MRAAAHRKLVICQTVTPHLFATTFSPSPPVQRVLGTSPTRSARERVWREGREVLILYLSEVAFLRLGHNNFWSRFSRVRAMKKGTYTLLHSLLHQHHTYTQFLTMNTFCPDVPGFWSSKLTVSGVFSSADRIS